MSLLGDLLKLVSGISPRIEIRVILLGQLEIGSLDIFLLGICLQTQHLYTHINSDITIVVRGSRIQGC